MALDVEAVHNALAAQLKANLARIASINVAAFPFSDMERPFIEVHPGSPWVEYWGTFGAGGIAFVNVTVHVELQVANGETWLSQASALLSAGTGKTNSIIDAILTDQTLGGVVMTCQVSDPDWSDSLDSFGQIAEIPVRIALRKTGAQA